MALKKKRKARKGKKTGSDYLQQSEQDMLAASSAMAEEQPLDEEGMRKKEAVLEALQQIKTSDFTELKGLRAPPALVGQIVTFTGELLLNSPCDQRRALQELISKPKVFIELSLGLEDRLEPHHLEVLRKIKAANIDLDQTRKISSSAYGLALWLTALVDFVNHPSSGVVAQAKFVTTAKKR